jgi:subtilisin family serine protease
MFLFSLLSNIWASTPVTNANRFVVDLIDNTQIQKLQSELSEEYIDFEFELVHPTTNDDALYYVNIKTSETDTKTSSQSLLDRFYTYILDHPLVETAEYSVQYNAFEYPNDPLYKEQWNMNAIQMNEIWSLQQSSNLSDAIDLSGTNIKVAVIDTGLSVGSDIVEKNVSKGISFVPSEPKTTDYNGHGTHVSGTIAQNTNNKIGVTGIAPNCTLIPYKVLGKFGGGQSEWVAAAIDAATKEKVDVINLSLGGPKSTIVQNAVRKAIQSGVIVVAATGNSGREGVSYPAAYDDVIGVASVGPDLKRASYSTFGKSVDIAAPGGVLKSPDPTKEESQGGILQQTISKSSDKFAFRSLQGTSMATPHVTGTVALLLGAGAQKEDIPSLLYENTKDIGDAGHDNYTGYGLLQAHSSLKKALSTQETQTSSTTNDNASYWTATNLTYIGIALILMSFFSGISIIFPLIASLILYGFSLQNHIEIPIFFQNLSNTVALTWVLFTIPYPTIRKINANLLVGMGCLGLFMDVEWDNWLIFMFLGLSLFFIQSKMGDYDGTTDYRNT